MPRIKKSKKIIYRMKDLYKEGMLPHRGYFRLISRVEIIDGEINFYYNVPKRPFWKNMHFPGDPIMPGVMLSEVGGHAAVLYEICHSDGL